MYKQNYKLTFTKDSWIKEFGNELTLNIESVGRPCGLGRYYFHCNECENQSIADDGNTCASCNNYVMVYNEEETKYYCKNYKKVIE